MEVFESMPVFLRTFWFVAIPTSLVFIVQTILTFVGTDATDGLDANFEGDLSGGDSPFQLFSLRNMINFLLGFSWSGISFYNSIESSSLLIGLSFLIGLVFFLLFFFLMQQVQKLSEDNTFKFSETINKTAEVYLTIPEAKSGKGKILISVKGSIHELDAMTEQERIPTGALVKVLKIENNTMLIVEKAL
ncbi:hypothetical protein AwDysgo_18910 [Bacteroidales bacterium]|nr:hypothetical protein AwDysgo_18910 [Bacteroidales bacterium]